MEMADETSVLTHFLWLVFQLILVGFLWPSFAL